MRTESLRFLCPNKKTFNAYIVLALVLVSALVASFVAASFYKTRTDEVVALADARFEKFTVLFDELRQTRCASSVLA